MNCFIIRHFVHTKPEFVGTRFKVEYNLLSKGEYRR